MLSCGFSSCGKDHVLFFFLLASSVREGERFLDNGQAACICLCVVVVCLFLSGFWAFHCFFDSSDLKGF